MVDKMISYVIPAYNEEKNIIKTIEMIHEYTPPGEKFEITVIDNGSTDNTIRMLQEKGITFYVNEEASIAGLRNYGVSKSHGDIYIFLDADIHLTKKWQDNIPIVLSEIRNGKRMLTGSWYSIPDNPNFIEKYWFKPLQDILNTHINSGHLIIGKQQFDELNGFDENLETGEDYDISMRAKDLNIDVIDNHELKVIHYGYPKSIWEFMQREYWHGKGDATSLKSVVNSKVASLSLIFLSLHIIFVLSLFLFHTPYISLAAISGIFLICIASSIVKFKKESYKVILINSMLYYLYFVSRAASVLHGLFGAKRKKRER